jgi:hypothetical protein
MDISNGASGKGIVANGADVLARDLIASSSPNTPVDAAGGSTVDIKNSDLTNSGSLALQASGASAVNAEEVDASGATNTAIRVDTGSRANLLRVTVNGGNSAALKVISSQVDARLGTLKASGKDVAIQDGAFVSLRNTQTTNGSPDVGDTTAPSFNNLSARGVIFS